MNKNVSILIIGLGSIGLRRYRNLLSLGYRHIRVYDVKKELGIRDKKSQIKKLTIESLKQFEVVFICSPNHLHIKHAILSAKAGCHLFIEKPLSYNLQGTSQLLRIVEQKRLVNLVACNMRFHPCLQFIKRYLDAGTLGRVYRIDHEFGHYLPFWRPEQDYRKTYSANRRQGGGIILDDIHEFDLLFWLNNNSPIKRSAWILGRLGSLRINTEDACIAAFEFKNGVQGSVRADYLQQRYSRNCKIVGEKGNLVWDYNENTVWLERQRSRKRLFAAGNFDVNRVYAEEMQYFFRCVNARRDTFNGVKRAAQTLRICLDRK